jgi:hypothetical protein
LKHEEKRIEDENEYDDVIVVDGVLPASNRLKTALPYQAPTIN